VSLLHELPDAALSKFHLCPISPPATATQSPDIPLKPVKTSMGSFVSDHTDYQSDSPLDPGLQSNGSQKSLLDMANASVSAELMNRLKTSSPETASNTHLVSKMMALDTSSLGSGSMMGSPIPGSPTGSSMGLSGAGIVPAVAAPRMSNAFARKHGLNPRDNPVVNLQKIALAGQVCAIVSPWVMDGAVHMGTSCCASVLDGLFYSVC
jgi:hypothetical protein